MKKKIGRLPRAARVVFFPVLFLSICLCGCGKGQHAPTLTLAGSTSVQPFVEKEAEAYMAAHLDMLINVQGGGSTAGVQAAREHVADIGMCSRHLKKEECDLTPITIAYDGLAIIVHPSNPVTDVSAQQVRMLFSGAIRNWREVGGRDMPVRLITREEGSGTRGAFQELIMGDKDISNEALVQDSNGAVREVVASDPNIVGYISLGLVDTRVKALKVDGVAPTEQNIREQKYRLVRPFLFLTNGTPSDMAKRFIDFVLSPEGQKLLRQEGLVPVRFED